MSHDGNAVRTVQHIGIEVHGGSAVVLIPAGSRTPVARAMTFTTVADGQGAVEVRVVRCVGAGEAAPGAGARTGGAPLAGRPAGGRPAGVVGRFLVPGLRRGARGEARIDIGISLDRHGVIRAWGADRQTGARQEAAFPGLWALPSQSRPQALNRLAGLLEEYLEHPPREAAALQAEGRLLVAHASDAGGGAFLAALAGEIDAVLRSTAHPPVEVR